MNITKHDLLFGDDIADSYTSEVSFLDALQRSRRPMRDASFKTKRHGTTKIKSVKIGGIVIATAAGCPVHFETDPDPQYSLLLRVAGSGSIAQGNKTVHFGVASIIRSSYQKPLSLDYGHYSGLTIRTDIPLLLKALNVADADK